MSRSTWFAILWLCGAGLVLSPASNGQSDTNVSYTAIDHFLSAVGAVKSYDAVVRVETLAMDDAPHERGRVLVVETNRDVYADGLGRRLERNVDGDKLGIGVIDWKTVTGIAKGRRVCPVLFVVNDALTYLGYLNPTLPAGFVHAGGVAFLTDVLRNPSFVVKPLDVSSTQPYLVGFQIENPEGYGICRMWLDSTHNYMLKELDYLVPLDNKPTLQRLVKVEKFIEPEKGVWVPASGAVTICATSGRPFQGQAMRLDGQRSSFNSIHSDELFLGTSLAHKNYQEDGWTWDYSPDTLADIKSRDFIVGEKHRKQNAHAFVGVLFVVSTLSIFLFINRYRRRIT